MRVSVGCWEELLEGGHHRAVVAEQSLEDGGLGVHFEGRGGKDVVRPRVSAREGHLSVVQQRVGVKVADHGVVEEGVRVGVVEVAKDDDGALRFSSEGVNVVGQGWKCMVCLGGVINVGVDDQHRTNGGGQALEVGVAEIGDELKTGGVLAEEGAPDEDGQALSS